PEEAFGQPMSSSSRRVMWKPSQEEETFDSLVNYRRVPLPNMVAHAYQPSSSNRAVTGLPVRKRTASENWLMLLRELGKKRASIRNQEQSKKEPTLKPHHSSATSLPEVKELGPKEQADAYWQSLFSGIYKRRPGEKEAEVDDVEQEQEEPADIALSIKPSLAMRYKPSHESLKYKRSRDLGLERYPSTSRGSPKLVTNLRVESLSMPLQQTCVVREVAPKFAQRMRMSLGNDTDSCCSGELEVPKNSRVLNEEANTAQQMRLRSELISVHVSAPTSSSFMEAARRVSTPIKRRSTTSKVATGAKISSASATPVPGANKCSSGSSGSTGNQLPNFRQRQQELHRYRVLIEQRRLDLLELKIAREREEALHSELLFHKDLQIKENLIKTYEDNDCSNA
ncbi:hypothetical protein KR009_008828, partial [Drosophila setifemur]